MFMVRSLITGFDDYANILFPLVDLESSLIGVREASDLPIDVSCSRCVAPAGHALLFAVGARPPHDGVRRARRLNLFHDLVC